MKPLWLTESDVEQLLTMKDAITIEEQAFIRLAEGGAQNPPRHRFKSGGLMMRVMSASVDGIGFGVKIYTGFGRGSRFVFMLWDLHNGTLLAMIEAKRLTQIRTGAATGLATKFMANREAATVGILGSGWQASAQLEAVCQVRPIQQARVFSRTPSHRESFAKEMSDRFGIEVRAVSSPIEAVSEVDVVVAITTADHPLFQASWLRPGTHINAAGRHVQEIELEIIRRAAVVTVDDLAQARVEAGDLISAVNHGHQTWETIKELSHLVAGHHPGRISTEDITLFVSLGIAIEDVAVARRVYDLAYQAGVGTYLPDTVLS